MQNIVETAKSQLAKEHRRLTIAFEMAQTRRGSTQEEIDALHRKIDVNLYLQQLINKEESQ